MTVSIGIRLFRGPLLLQQTAVASNRLLWKTVRQRSAAYWHITNQSALLCRPHTHTQKIPEFYGCNIAHAPQQGPFAQPAGYISPQLWFRLCWQAAVNKCQAVGKAERSGQISSGQSTRGIWEPAELMEDKMEKADEPLATAATTHHGLTQLQACCTDWTGVEKHIMAD